MMFPDFAFVVPYSSGVEGKTVCISHKTSSLRKTGIQWRWEPAVFF